VPVLVGGQRAPEHHLDRSGQPSTVRVIRIGGKRGHRWHIGLGAGAKVEGGHVTPGEAGVGEVRGEDWPGAGE
jgi:hypothetical protein